MTTVPLYLIPPEEITRWYVSLSTEERQRWRTLAISTCLEIMRDSRDVHLRQHAYDTVVTLLDVKPASPWRH